jgi:hypothetical protein
MIQTYEGDEQQVFARRENVAWWQEHLSAPSGVTIDLRTEIRLAPSCGAKVYV